MYVDNHVPGGCDHDGPHAAGGGGEAEGGVPQLGAAHGRVACHGGNSQPQGRGKQGETGEMRPF